MTKTEREMSSLIKPILGKINLDKITIGLEYR